MKINMAEVREQLLNQLSDLTYPDERRAWDLKTAIEDYVDAAIREALNDRLTIDANHE